MGHTRRERARLEGAASMARFDGAEIGEKRDRLVTP